MSSRCHSPAALRDGLVDGFVHLFVVIVLIPSMFPHVGLEGRRMAAHVTAEGAPEERNRFFFRRTTNYRSTTEDQSYQEQDKGTL